jgi:ParB-like chromosome segregation protein Spo0J
MKIAIEKIIIPENHRPLDQGKVAEIADSMKRIGLMNPICVQLHKGAATLVFGRHRLEACRRLGWTMITAVEPVDILPSECGLDDDAVEMMEIAENLYRSDLTTGQRNEHLARWVALVERRKPDIEATASISKKPGRKPSRAVVTVAKQFGLSTQTVKEAIKTAKLAPKVKAAANDAKLSHKQLLAIARLPKADQLDAVLKQAAINIKADRAEATVANRATKSLPAVTSLPDRTEVNAKLAVVATQSGTAPSDNPATLIGLLRWFDRMSVAIDLEPDIAGMSEENRIILDALVTRAQAWLGQIALVNAGASRAQGVAP